MDVTQRKARKRKKKKGKEKALTHDFAKDPGVSSLVDLDQDGGHADAKDEDVGQAQIQQEQIGRIAQVAIVPNDDRYEAIADQSHHQNQTARQHHQQTDVGRETFVVHDVVTGRRRARRQRRQIIAFVEVRVGLVMVLALAVAVAVAVVGRGVGRRRRHHDAHVARQPVNVIVVDRIRRSRSQEERRLKRGTRRPRRMR